MIRTAVRPVLLMVALGVAVGVASLAILAADPDGPTVDSRLSLYEARRGTTAPRHILDSLTIIEVHHLGFDGKIHSGQLVLNKQVAPEVADLLRQEPAQTGLLDARRVVPDRRLAHPATACDLSLSEYGLVFEMWNLSGHADG